MSFTSAGKSDSSTRIQNYKTTVTRLPRTLYKSRTSTQVKRKETNKRKDFVCFRRQELEKCRVDFQSNEVQNYLKQEIQRKEEVHRNELAHQQEK